MSDYKQTRDAAGKVTSQYGQMLRNLDDDLVERLNDRRVCSLAQNSCRNDHVLNQAEVRMKELADNALANRVAIMRLEAKLAKAVEAIFEAIYLLDPDEEDIAKGTGLYRIVTTFKELKGEKDEK